MRLTLDNQPDVQTRPQDHQAHADFRRGMPRQASCQQQLITAAAAAGIHKVRDPSPTIAVTHPWSDTRIPSQREVYLTLGRQQ